MMYDTHVTVDLTGVSVMLTACQALLRGAVEAIAKLLEVAEELAADGHPFDKVTTGKAWAVQHILQSCNKKGKEEKLVIFAQYLMDLDELELALQQVISSLNSRPCTAKQEHHCKSAPFQCSSWL